MLVGLATTELPVVDERPVAGLQVYVLPPVADNGVLLPEQIVDEPAEAMRGLGNTDIV